MFYKSKRKMRRQGVIDELTQQVADLTERLAAERKVNDGLQKGIILACDPRSASADRVVEVMEQAATDVDAAVVQAPDGEYIAPEAYNWERLAWDIYDNEQGSQGGASGSW